MMFKRLLMCATVTISFVTASAQNIDQIYEKSGSVYYGYIAEQAPGIHIVAQAEYAVLYVNEADVSQVETNYRLISELPKQMQEWAKVNLPLQREVVMANLQVGDRRYEDVILLEQGVRVKFATFTPDRYQIPWKELYKTTKTVYEAGEMGGIKDIVTTKAGKRYEGQIIEQIIGKEVRIKTTDGAIYVVSFSEMQSIRSERIDYNKTLWEQIPYWDCIEVIGVGQVEGFIAARVMGSHLTMILREGDVERNYPINKVKRYTKILSENWVEPSNQEEPQTEPEEVIEEPSQLEEEVPVEAYPQEEAISEEDASDSLEDTTVTIEEEYAEESPLVEEKESEILFNGVAMECVEIRNLPSGGFVLTQSVKHTVPLYSEVCIEVPAAEVSDLKIVKTSKLSVEPDIDPTLWPGLYYACTEKDVDKADKNFFTIDPVSDGVEMIRFVPEKAGLYILYPIMVESNNCLAFEVTTEK